MAATEEKTYKYVKVTVKSDVVDGLRTTQKIAVEHQVTMMDIEEMVQEDLKACKEKLEAEYREYQPKDEEPWIIDFKPYKFTYENKLNKKGPKEYTLWMDIKGDLIHILSIAQMVLGEEEGTRTYLWKREEHAVSMDIDSCASNVYGFVRSPLQGGQAVIDRRNYEEFERQGGMKMIRNTFDEKRRFRHIDSKIDEWFGKWNLENIVLPHIQRFPGDADHITLRITELLKEVITRLDLPIKVDHFTAEDIASKKRVRED
jgi:hypothetical protein